MIYSIEKIQNIAGMMPYYPNLKVEIVRSKMSDTELSKIAHMTPARFRASVEGTAKHGFTMSESSRLASYFGKKFSYLFFCPEDINADADACRTIGQLVDLLGDSNDNDAAIKQVLGENMNVMSRQNAINYMRAFVTLIHMKHQQFTEEM